MDLSERHKGLIYIATMTFIFGVGFFFISNNAINKINNLYIKQNTALIGTLANEKGFNEEKVIGIITKGNLNGYEEGRKILKKYSYKEDISTNVNPVLKESKKILYTGVIGGFFIFSLVILIYVYLRERKNLKVAKALINRASNIIEGKFEDKNFYKLHDGDFETLYESFSLMEDRIKNDISEIKKEKENLKHIISDISHQLKTPLTALMTYIDILKDYKNMSSEDIENFIDLSYGQLERMDWLIITLLKYARLEGKVVKYNKENISMLQTVKVAIEPLKIKADEKRQNIILEHEDKEYLFKHDRKWISEAISNIIKNAIEHTKEEGKIKIRLKETLVYLEVSIEDTGDGIPEDKLKKIFERFYKSSSSKKPKSIGIGLHLSKTIIEGNNGSISVRSKIGVGSTFIIRFVR